MNDNTRVVTAIVGASDSNETVARELGECVANAATLTGATIVATNDGQSHDDTYGVEYARWLAATLPIGDVALLRALLDDCRVRYGQDAIALTVGETTMVGAS